MTDSTVVQAGETIGHTMRDSARQVDIAAVAGCLGVRAGLKPPAAANPGGPHGSIRRSVALIPEFQSDGAHADHDGEHEKRNAFPPRPGSHFGALLLLTKLLPVDGASAFSDILSDEGENHQQNANSKATQHKRCASATDDARDTQHDSGNGELRKHGPEPDGPGGPQSAQQLP
jgi:hypothetical protein